MNHSEEYGSLNFNPNIDDRIVKVKPYQVLYDEILSMIPKQNLDDMPTTNRTTRMRLQQIENLLRILDAMPAMNARIDYKVQDWNSLYTRKKLLMDVNFAAVYTCFMMKALSRR